VAQEYGLQLVGWTADSHDWRGDSAADMFAATRSGLRAGAIVLVHDGIGPGARRADARETLGFVGRCGTARRIARGRAVPGRRVHAPARIRCAALERPGRREASPGGE